MDSLWFIFLVLMFGVGANWWMGKRGFFTSPLLHQTRGIFLNLLTVIGLFVTYLGCSLLLPSALGTLFRSSFIENPVKMMNWTQLFTMSLSVLFLFLFSRGWIAPGSLAKIWKDRECQGARSIGYDFGSGIFCWILAFPLVVVVGDLCDLLIYSVFGAQNYEQVAVVYLKMTKEHPSMLIIALGMILVAAPCVEEYLFRGILQNWLRRHLGAKAAILLASLCFALFHFASSQGWGNVSLVVSLFLFACFLGFIYEKQRSLFASIGLHMAFNTVSALRILFWSAS